MKRRWIHFVLVIVLLFALFPILFDLPLIHWLELKSIDQRFHNRGPIPATGDVVVVAIDEKSLHKIGRWPWSRDKVSQLIEGVRKAGARWIEMDIVFSEPSPQDTQLAQSLQASDNVILGYFFYQDPDELELAELTPAMIESSYQSILPTALPDISALDQALIPMVGVLSNTTMLAQATRSRGFFNAVPDEDGVIRHFPLMVSYRNHIFPSLALETFSHHESFDAVPVSDRNGALEGLSIGKRFIPTDSKGQIWINYRGGREQFQIYSAADILDGSVDPKTLRDRTVLIGATAVGVYDLRVTPISPNFPGVLIQANLIDNLYKGDILISNPWTKFASLVLTLIVIFGLVIILPRIRILYGLVLMVALVGLHYILVQWSFGQGYILAQIVPATSWTLLFVSLTLYRGLTEEKEKRLIRKAFQSYLHPDIVAELTNDLEKLKLGGQRMDCTILFADVRNFTVISERMSPEKLVELMNAYFDPIAKAIIQAGGYIDKFIGDAIMVVFGAPKPSNKHAVMACRTALAMQRIVTNLAPSLEEKFSIEHFAIGIGLHSGPVIVGNIGTKERLNYTVMGDTVNLASRLEEATKALEVSICLSETTQQLIANQLETHYLNEITVKGKQAPIRVYELIDE